MPDNERLGDGPIQAELLKRMNETAAALDVMFNGAAHGPDRKVGFVLLVFPFTAEADPPDLRGDASRCNFISNGADRRDVVVLFKEMIQRFEGQPELKGTA